MLRLVCISRLCISSSMDSAAKLVEAQLGYTVPNMVGVAAWTRDGAPAVVETYPLRRDHRKRAKVEPFPTLFWLTDRRLSAAVASVEACGGITRAREQMRADPDKLARLRSVHERYKARRWAHLTLEDSRLVEARGWAPKLAEVGIAGLTDFSDVKCLHAHYASYLVDRAELVHPPNPLGQWVHDRLPVEARALVD